MVLRSVIFKGKPSYLVKLYLDLQYAKLKEVEWPRTVTATPFAAEPQSLESVTLIPGFQQRKFKNHWIR